MEENTEMENDGMDGLIASLAMPEPEETALAIAERIDKAREPDAWKGQECHSCTDDAAGACADCGVFLCEGTLKECDNDGETYCENCLPVEYCVDVSSTVYGSITVYAKDSETAQSIVSGTCGTGDVSWNDPEEMSVDDANTC